jgi:aromatic ring-opening dioxygenase catalytic subunit (LigB family)
LLVDYPNANKQINRIESDTRESLKQMSIGKMVSKAILPTLFISHGGGPGFFMKVDRTSPFYEISQDSEACAALREVGKNRSKFGLPENPSSIVVISAHWEEDDAFHVYSVERPELIYDYYGFPRETYALKYQAPGNVELAARVVALVNQEPGIKAVLDPARAGFDHGVFLPLMMLYPEANIPIVQVSLKSSLNVKEHFVLGKALSPLREENILIVCSGQATHPMAGGSSPASTEKFVELLRQAVETSVTNESQRLESLSKLWSSPLIRATHNPRTEHLMPVVVAGGAARGAPGRELFKRDKDFRFMGGAFSMASFVFSSQATDDAIC